VSQTDIKTVIGLKDRRHAHVLILTIGEEFKDRNHVDNLNLTIGEDPFLRQHSIDT